MGEAVADEDDPEDTGRLLELVIAAAEAEVVGPDADRELRVSPHAVAVRPILPGQYVVRNERVLMRERRRDREDAGRELQAAQAEQDAQCERRHGKRQRPARNARVSLARRRHGAAPP